MVLTKLESLDKDEEHLCNMCLEKKTIAEGIHTDENFNVVCEQCKQENEL